MQVLSIKREMRRMRRKIVLWLVPVTGSNNSLVLFPALPLTYRVTLGKSLRPREEKRAELSSHIWFSHSIRTLNFLTVQYLEILLVEENFALISCSSSWPICNLIFMRNWTCLTQINFKLISLICYKSELYTSLNQLNILK